MTDTTQPTDTPARQEKRFADVVPPEPTKADQQIAELQEQLTAERDGRREDRFVGIVLLAILLDIVFFSVISFGGALAILVLELLILIPLAKRMGMQEIALIISGVLERLAGKAGEKNN